MRAQISCQTDRLVVWGPVWWKIAAQRMLNKRNGEGLFTLGAKKKKLRNNY